MCSQDASAESFGDLKKAAREECKILHERLLLPQHSDVLTISGSNEQLDVVCEVGSRFSFPSLCYLFVSDYKYRSKAFVFCVSESRLTGRLYCQNTENLPAWQELTHARRSERTIARTVRVFPVPGPPMSSTRCGFSP